MQIAGEGAHTYCVGLGLDVGDRLTRLNGGKDAVVVTTQDGRRVRLDLSVALLVEVEPAVPS